MNETNEAKRIEVLEEKVKRLEKTLGETLTVLDDLMTLYDERTPFMGNVNDDTHIYGERYVDTLCLSDDIFKTKKSFEEAVKNE